MRPDERRTIGASIRTLLAGSEHESQESPMKQPPLKITTLTRDGALHVVADGELDLATAPALRDALVTAEASDASTIVLDIDAVGFIDSSGLRALIEAHARSEQNGKRLRITKGTEAARRLFALTGADAGLPFIDVPARTSPAP
jgi:anti-anti-sigma factor